MKIQTTLGEIDESLLQKYEGGFEDDNEKTRWVEYCLKECDGVAHRTGIPEAAPVFCKKHIHRSVHIDLKKPLVFEGGLASF